MLFSLSTFKTFDKHFQQNRRGPPPAPALQRLRPPRPARDTLGHERRQPPTGSGCSDFVRGARGQQRRARRGAAPLVFRAAAGRGAEGAADAELGGEEGRGE